MGSLVSIIVPHYNTLNTLLRLIRSIPVRDDIEVLIVDDNSDIPLEKLRYSLEEFPHVQLFQNDSGVKGAGASRNIALRKALGKWLLFADADDYFTEGFYEKIFPYLESDYDIVYFPPTSMDEATGKEASRHIKYMERVNNYYNNPSFENRTVLRFGFGTPWSKLIRRSIFEEHKLEFEEILVGNDIMCMTRCGYYSHNIKASNETIYCVTRGSGTLTSKKDEKNFDMRTALLIREYCFLRDNLSKEEFKLVHMERLALRRLVIAAFIDRWGIKKLLEILRLYRKNKIKVFDIGLLNPIEFLRAIKKAVIYNNEMKKHR